MGDEEITHKSERRHTDGLIRELYDRQTTIMTDMSKIKQTLIGNGMPGLCQDHQELKKTVFALIKTEDERYLDHEKKLVKLFTFGGALLTLVNFFMGRFFK